MCMIMLCDQLCLAYFIGLFWWWMTEGESDRINAIRKAIVIRKLQGAGKLFYALHTIF